MLLVTPVRIVASQCFGCVHGSAAYLNATMAFRTRHMFALESPIVSCTTPKQQGGGQASHERKGNGRERNQQQGATALYNAAVPGDNCRAKGSNCCPPRVQRGKSKGGEGGREAGRVGGVIGGGGGYLMCMRSSVEQDRPRSSAHVLCNAEAYTTATRFLFFSVRWMDRTPPTTLSRLGELFPGSYSLNVPLDSRCLAGEFQQPKHDLRVGIELLLKDDHCGPLHRSTNPTLVGQHKQLCARKASAERKKNKRNRQRTQIISQRFNFKGCSRP